MDIGDQAGQRQAAAHDGGRDAERVGNLVLGAALGEQRGEGGVLVELVHRQALDVLGQARLDGGRVVVRLDHDAGHVVQRVGVGLGVVRDLLQRLEAALAADHLEAVRVPAHDQRLQQANRADRGGEAVDGLGAVLAHVQRGGVKVAERKMGQ